MPTYHYMCSSCGQRFEVFHAMSATPPATCADIRAMMGTPVGAQTGSHQDCVGAVERELTGGTGLIFKGSGFYITDYKDGKNGGGSKSEGAAAESASKSAEAKDVAAPAEAGNQASSSGSTSASTAPAGSSEAGSAKAVPPSNGGFGDKPKA